MKVVILCEGGPKAVGLGTLLISVAAILYIALGYQLALHEAAQIALVSGYGQLTAFLAGSRG
ncbi:hypothetical protein AB0L25_36825 [Spirillospora sp. NPDC052242]